MKGLLIKLYQEKAKIQLPTINYPALLKDLEKAMEDNNDHYVCHFCGAPLTCDTMNSECPKNKII